VHLLLDDLLKSFIYDLNSINYHLLSFDFDMEYMSPVAVSTEKEEEEEWGKYAVP
jgi:hypothetical protein